jgi:DNA-binding IclR family transcriptional regulator
MARLFAGEKDCKSDDVLRVLRSHELGLRESELAEFLEWDRRTVNNYLRDLQSQDRIHKDGRLWFADE